MHLVGFTTEVYYDAQLYERQLYVYNCICNYVCKTRKSGHVGRKFLMAHHKLLRHRGQRILVDIPPYESNLFYRNQCLPYFVHSLNIAQFVFEWLNTL